MSHALISRSPDLKRLRDEGYDITVRAGYLLVKRVPYVNARREVRRGVLVSKLSLAGEVTTQPDTHVMFFAGDYPCNRDGSEIEQIRNNTHLGKTLADGVIVDHTFSAKPQGGRYANYYEKVIAYVRILSGPAEALDPSATAQTFPVVTPDEQDDSVFNYLDTASSRAEIVTATRKLELAKVVIVGLGGTGSYVLDFVAKVPVKEICLIDGDNFHQHNAFRAPGAPSREELETKPMKVDYFKGIYSKMHRGIVAHPCFLTEENLDLLAGADFVFLCFDGGPAKRKVVEQLLKQRTPFVDVGMGLTLADGAVSGLLRVTTATEESGERIVAQNRIPVAPSDEEDDYSTNIQVADLNALNAALAVIRWKKLFGFYLDLEGEHHSTYSISGNEMTNERLA